MLLWWKFCAWNTIACKSLKPQKFFSLFFQSGLSCSNFYPLHTGLTELNEGANAWQDSHLPYIWEQTPINLLISWKRSCRSWSASSLGIDSFMILKIKQKNKQTKNRNREHNFFNDSPLSSKRISFLGKLFMKNSEEMAFFSLTCEPKWVTLLHPWSSYKIQEKSTDH